MRHSVVVMAHTTPHIVKDSTHLDLNFADVGKICHLPCGGVSQWLSKNLNKNKDAKLYKGAYSISPALDCRVKIPVNFGEYDGHGQYLPVTIRIHALKNGDSADLRGFFTNEIAGKKDMNDRSSPLWWRF